MQNFILSVVLFFCAATSFSQKPKENGTIYITHPYIDVVNKSVESYVANDFKALSSVFSDTAKIWISGMEKELPAAEVLKMWTTDFDFYDSISVTKFGYPDYLHYKDKDQKWVQSWWKWSGKSKKTGEIVKIDFVQFDRFDNAGKIVMEGLYGDFSKMVKE